MPRRKKKTPKRSARTGRFVKSRGRRKTKRKRTTAHRRTKRTRRKAKRTHRAHASVASVKKVLKKAAAEMDRAIKKLPATRRRKKKR